MNQFDELINNKRILVSPESIGWVQKELTAALDDLQEARDRFQNGKYKYATITAYYAMFHAARGLIYSKAYRERSHYALFIALETLFVATGQLEGLLVETFREVMLLREEADYGGIFSEEGAALCISSAEKFVTKAKTILTLTGITT